MRLLLVAFPRLSRLVPPTPWLVNLTFLALLVSLECIGRVAPWDLFDLLAAIALLAGVFFILARHKRHPIGWIDKLRDRLARALRVEYQHGYDLRGDPPYPARLPPGFWFVAAALAGLGLAAALASNLTTGGLRSFALGGSYVVYLLGLVALWFGMGLAALAGLGLPYFVLSLFVRRPLGRGKIRPSELIGLVSYLVVVWSFAHGLPPVMPLIVAGIAVGTMATRLARRHPDDAALLWRADESQAIYAVPLRLFVASGLALAIIAIASISVAACGPWLFRFPPASKFATEASIEIAMAQSVGFVATPTAGAFIAWLMPGAAAALAVCLVIFGRLDPAARSNPTASIGGARPGAELISAARQISSWGWRIRRPGGLPADVAVELVTPQESEAFAFDARWPLRVAAADLADPSVRDRLSRRDELTLRREALRGVRTLLAHGFEERKVRGGSFQLAPHWGFFDRMTREEPRRGRSGKPRPVGPAFQRIFTPRVRQHLHAVFRAAQIDILLIEDGVSQRGLRLVLKAVFELYDKTRGSMRAEELHFGGVPKVRVMFHDYAPEVPFRATRYAEPHLDDLDRARVMHIFRDHGGEKVKPDDPFDLSWEPAPTLGIS